MSVFFIYSQQGEPQYRLNGNFNLLKTNWLIEGVTSLGSYVCKCNLPVLDCEPVDKWIDIQTCDATSAVVTIILIIRPIYTCHSFDALHM